VDSIVQGAPAHLAVSSQPPAITDENSADIVHSSLIIGEPLCAGGVSQIAPRGFGHPSWPLFCYGRWRSPPPGFREPTESRSRNDVQPRVPNRKRVIAGPSPAPCNPWFAANGRADADDRSVAGQESTIMGSAATALIQRSIAAHGDDTLVRCRPRPVFPKARSS